MPILHIPEVCDPQNPEHVRLHSSNSYKNATPYRENATPFSGTYRLAYNQEIPSPPPPSSGNGARKQTELIRRTAIIIFIM